MAGVNPSVADQPGTDFLSQVLLILWLVCFHIIVKVVSHSLFIFFSKGLDFLGNYGFFFPMLDTDSFIYLRLQADQMCIRYWYNIPISINF